MVCAPVRYVPAAIVCAVVPGVMVAAPFVVTLALKLTLAFPAVPLEMYPAAVTSGVTDMVLLSVMTFVPVDTVALDPLIVDGAVTLPLATDAEADEL